MLKNEQAYDIPRWYVIKSQPKQETRAETNLNAWNVETFLPRMKERRQQPHTGAATYSIRPLFPGYLFARFQASALFHKINFTRGVQSIVGFGSGPVAVEDEVIELIQSHVREDGCVRLEEEFKAGDRVMIKEGPLKNLTGVFQRDLTPSDRVMILLTTVSYQGSLTVERYAVAKAG